MNKNSLHPHRTLRRSATVVGGALMGMIAVLAFSTPALACHPEITPKGEVICDTTTGKWVATWEIKSDDIEGKVLEVKAEPEGSTVDNIVGKTIPAKDAAEPLVVQQILPPNDDAWAKLSVKGHFEGKDDVWGAPKEGLHYGGPCEKDVQPTTAPPTTSPTTAPATPAETPSASPSPGGGASLPLTGSSIGAAVGIAVGLLAIGAVLFYVFRRRRIRFTA